MAKTTTFLLVTLGLLLLPIVGTGSGAQAAIQFLDDGALHNNSGTWDLPAQGTCPADLTQTTRPACTALRFNLVQAACVSPNYSWTTSGVCNDLVNTTQEACEAKTDRLWNAATTVCAVVMLYDDRNDVTCMLHGGTWVTAGTCTGAWVMPARTVYTPNLLTANGPGDQCLRCHNSVTQYNSPRVRDTQFTLRQGHKNMSRKVTPGMPWAGPNLACSNPLYSNESDCELNGGTWAPDFAVYPTDDSGNAFDWLTGQITVAGSHYDLTWIYADWLAPLPRAIYKAPASASKVCTDPRYTSQSACESNGGTWVFNAGVSYSCARCHTTGWTSDAAINTATDLEGKEPELSFPGITWDRNGNAPANVVNLSGGVSGDADRYASWDTFGITCTRCHGSAINTLSPVSPPETPPRYSAPAGMSSHHSGLTAPDASNGVCTDSKWTAEAQCTAASGTWLTACSVNPTAGVCTQGVTTQAACVSPGVWVAAPGSCSNAFFTDQASCVANGNSPPFVPFTWQAGWCSRPDKDQVSCSGGSGSAALTWRTNGSQASCQVASASWSFSKCSVAGACNQGTCSDPSFVDEVTCVEQGGTWTGYPTKTSCEAAGGQFRYATDVVRCDDAGGRWTGNNTNRGPIITRLCMDCHRQETGGLPYGATSADGVNVDYAATHPGEELKVGPYHGTVTFLSHPQGGQFLNSPHAKFSGTFDKIATGKFNFAGTGEYKSFFQTDGEAANTGNACTGCHNVHKSVVEQAGEDDAIHEECTDCHAKNLGALLHPAGGGTPLERMATEPAHACITCHMPDGVHLFRVSSDASYSTFPLPAALTTTQNANTAPDGNYASAVWVDLDRACGQCHGGGSSQAQTTGSTVVGSKVLTVASTTGFLPNQRIRIADAGALEYDDVGIGRGNFESYVVSVVPPATINLAGAPSLAVSNKAVVQNPTKNNAAYFTKTMLAGYARDIHNDKPYATFGYTLGSPNTLTVNVNAGASTCNGSNANCDAYDWDWGDGSPNGTGVTASHTYATAGAKVITLTVEQFGVNEGTVSRTVTVYAPDLPPTVAPDCPPFNANTWTQTVSDASTDDHGIRQVTVNWGDGSVIASDLTAPFGPFSHTYLNPGAFTITHKAIDTIGQQSVRTCAAAPAYFTIGGTVFQSGGVIPVPAAVVQLKKSGVVVKTVATAADGTFSAGSLKPGTYTLTVTKAGYSFVDPAATLTVGPSGTTSINALAPNVTFPPIGDDSTTPDRPRSPARPRISVPGR